ncbi:putative ZIP metal ion transporter [Metarhizium anisopliae]|nr:putative ZIP metal ion transporter [Metarhizium anisopliae]
MAGILLLLGLCVVMAVASFLAGALPLSMTLSQSQLRLISSIGVGVLVGTSLIVIIPEGIEAAASSPITSSHAHKVRSLSRRSPWKFGLEEREIIEQLAAVTTRHQVNRDDGAKLHSEPMRIIVSQSTPTPDQKRDDQPSKPAPTDDSHDSPKKEGEKHKEEEHVEIPAFEVGFSMILGFILMFLIDRLPKHASDSLQSGPQPQHFSLDNLGGNGIETTSVDEEQGFLGSLAPTPKHTRTLATTIGLVIHAAADGIAMGASSASSNVKLGFIIFIAIMIHKAPAAFGLTSVLLRQGLSKRAARGHLAVFSLAAPVGALSTWLMIKLLGGDHLDGDAGMWWTGMLLLFSGGTFLYVAMHAMQEEGSSHNHESHSTTNGYSDGTPSVQRKSKGPEIRDTLATVAGMLLPLLTQFGHHH